MTEAESYDLDGVVIPGTVPFPVADVAKFFRESPLAYVPPPILPLDRKVEETYFLPLKQLLPFFIQTTHTVAPGMWEYLWSRPADVYGNTGRPNKRPWINLTEWTLSDGNLLPRFKKIFYKPRGVESIQSKGAALMELAARYDMVTHYDDDPWVVFGLAGVFLPDPRIRFVLVQDLDSGILYSDADKKRFPNVSYQAQLKYVEW